MSKINVKSITEIFFTGMTIIAVLFLALILNSLVATGLLWAINHFWNPPAWLAFTRAHVIGLTIVMTLLSVWLGNVKLELKRGGRL